MVMYRRIVHKCLILEFWTCKAKDYEIMKDNFACFRWICLWHWFSFESWYPDVTMAIDYVTDSIYASWVISPQHVWHSNGKLGVYLIVRLDSESTLQMENVKGCRFYRFGMSPVSFSVKIVSLVKIMLYISRISIHTIVFLLLLIIWCHSCFRRVVIVHNQELLDYMCISNGSTWAGTYCWYID